MPEVGTTDAVATETPTAEPDQQGNPDEVDLGDKGKAAINRMKIERDEAKRNAATLQAELDKVARANESAIEKVAREAAEAKSQVEKVPSLVAAQLRDYLVSLHDITEDDRDLFLTGADPETILKQAARLVERDRGNAPTGPRPDPTQGVRGGPPALNSDPLLDDIKSRLGIA